MKNKYWGVPATARLLNVEVKRIYELLYSGRLLGAEKEGGRWRIPGKAIEARLRKRAGQHGSASR
jgi:Helix-turn-helix domain